MKIEMKTRTMAFIVLFLILPSSAVFGQQDKLKLFFKLSDYYFGKYVYNGLVDYKYASTYSKEIDALYSLMGEVDLSNATQNEKKAFCTNAYNLLVVYQVAKSYPIAKPLDQEGFFDQNKHNVAGKSLTLNELEIDMILGEFQDARFHFVLACAAMSCPRLANFAYRPENVNQLLEERTKITLNDDEFIRVNTAEKKVSISKIFEWYQGDFTRNNASLIEFINRYRTEKIPSDYQVDFYEYDWTLNERKS